MAQARKKQLRSCLMFVLDERRWPARRGRILANAMKFGLQMYQTRSNSKQ
jgi:hypothetical protein